MYLGGARQCLGSQAGRIGSVVRAGVTFELMYISGHVRGIVLKTNVFKVARVGDDTVAVGDGGVEGGRLGGLGVGHAGRGGRAGQDGRLLDGSLV